jgi:hypothetical protein
LSRVSPAGIAALGETIPVISSWQMAPPANITLETHVKLKKKVLDDLGDDFEKTAEEGVIATLVNKPENFFNPEKLR